jgi:trehalose/maltose transport system substrate-binding protein
MPVATRVAVLLSTALAFIGPGSVLTARQAAAQGGAPVSVACGSVGAEFDLCKTGAEAWAKKTGNQVKVVSVPKDSNEQLALFQQLLSQKSG